MASRCLNILRMRGPVLTQKQSNDLDAEDKPLHLSLYKKGGRRNYFGFSVFHGPLITAELFLNHANHHVGIVEDDRESETGSSQ